MSCLSEHLDEYLRVRRALGFKLEFPGIVLPQFIEFIEARGDSTVTTELAIAWSGLPGTTVLPISLSHRLGAVRGFARWLQTIDPETEIPPAGIWPSTSPRPEPRIWTPAEIDKVLDAARSLSPELVAITHYTLLGLLACSGMRVGEALALTDRDVDLDRAVVTIRHAKFERERLVPIHPSAAERLATYANRRNDIAPRRTTDSFFISKIGSPLRYSSVRVAFTSALGTAGLGADVRRPTIHGLRHSFAVRTLLEWHRAGADVASKMVMLSNYLGHSSAEGTFWYLSAVPELMEIVAAKLCTRGGAAR